MFEFVKLSSPDPILGIIDDFRADPRTDKINLGIGVYQNNSGNTPIFDSVKEAESLILKNEMSKNYLNIEGMSEFINCTQRLLLGADNKIIRDHRLCTVQTPGGTGAIRIAADFLSKNTITKHVWISNPSWTNHMNVFNAAGIQICYYSYYDSKMHNLDFSGMLKDLKYANDGDVLLLHACCHNPTGMDFSDDQWHELAKLSSKNNLLPLFDLAYQGFGNGLNEDLRGINIFSNYHEEFIICNSYSKNFGLYNERIGACTIVATTRHIAECSLSQLKSIIRATYSNPPVHGAAIVSTILNNDRLRHMWEEELNYIRKQIKYTRQLFAFTLDSQGATGFDFINQQNGMFSFIDLDYDQVMALRKKSGIYMTNSARINIAGITPQNVVPICKAIITVL